MKLSDKIWVTRKTRINSEKRLKSYALLSDISIIFYSLLIVFLSISGYIKPNDKINYLTICSSVSLLVISVFISSTKFTERANAMRNCYIRLHELYYKVIESEKHNDSEKLFDYQSYYNDMLLNIENHSDYDFLYLRFDLRKKNDTTLDPFTLSDWIVFILQTFLKYMVFFITIFLPFIILLIWINFN